MAINDIKLIDLRPGMEHIKLKLKIVKIIGQRQIKTYSGLNHLILEGEVTDDSNNIPFAVWNETISLFDKIQSGDWIEISDCFVTSFKGILQINIGRDSTIKKVGV